MTLFDVEESSKPAAPAGPLVRVRMTVAYDGTRFHGFAAQPGLRTVGGSLAEAMAKVLRHDVDITCAGRTDKGVHAWGQVVSADVSADRFEPVAFQRSLNAMLGPEVAVRDVGEAPEGFDARHSARARVYRYRIYKAATPSPFEAHRSWHITEELDRRCMELACDPLLGEHDFAAFCRKPPDGGSTTRRVIDARWVDEGPDSFRFEIEANAFCHQMVRALVGTMVDVGRGRIRAGDISWVIRTKDRHKAGQLAPPHGLYLWEVKYGASGASGASGA